MFILLVALAGFAYAFFSMGALVTTVKVLKITVIVLVLFITCWLIYKVVKRVARRKPLAERQE